MVEVEVQVGEAAVEEAVEGDQGEALLLKEVQNLTAHGSSTGDLPLTAHCPLVKN